MGKAKRRAVCALAAGALVAAGVVARAAAMLPGTVCVAKGEGLQLAAYPWLKPAPALIYPAAAAGADGSRNETLTLMEVLPLKTVRVVETKRRTVEVLGTPFGMKMFSDGAMVVGFTDVETPQGLRSPAKEAGLKLGDLLVSLNGQKELNNDRAAEAIQESGGSALRLVYRRGGQEHEAELTPAWDEETGQYRAGMWLRDSAAGVGTLTFADPENRSYGGLGHAISDRDTGKSVALRAGEVVPVEIVGLTRGTRGEPGELKGVFGQSGAMGSILANDETGVYGRLMTDIPQGQPMEVAMPQEVQAGPAKILATAAGRTPEWYDVTIERVNLNSRDANRDLLLRVTDAKLLEKTGGILQGMSGSPIVQNGRLVGAVTHVLVNDPAKGYGIFAKTMLDSADRALETG